MVLFTPFRAQVTTLSVLPPSEEDQELNSLLKVYIEHSAPFRQSEQLFVCLGGHAKGHPVTKQRLSKWIVTLLCYPTLPWAYNAPLEYNPIQLGASPLLGRGLASLPLQKFVCRPVGPRHPHLLGFIA